MAALSAYHTLRPGKLSTSRRPPGFPNRTEGTPITMPPSATLWPTVHEIDATPSETDRRCRRQEAQLSALIPPRSRPLPAPFSTCRRVASGLLARPAACLMGAYYGIDGQPRVMQPRYPLSRRLSISHLVQRERHVRFLQPEARDISPVLRQKWQQPGPIGRGQADPMPRGQ